MAGSYLFVEITLRRRNHGVGAAPSQQADRQALRRRPHQEGHSRQDRPGRALLHPRPGFHQRRFPLCERRGRFAPRGAKPQCQRLRQRSLAEQAHRRPEQLGLPVLAGTAATRPIPNTAHRRPDRPDPDHHGSARRKTCGQVHPREGHGRRAGAVRTQRSVRPSWLERRRHAWSRRCRRPDHAQPCGARLQRSRFRKRRRKRAQRQRRRHDSRRCPTIWTGTRRPDLYRGDKVDFSWQVASSADGAFAEVATGDTYTVEDKHAGKYLRVVATARNGVPGHDAHATEPGRILAKGVTTLYSVSILNTSRAALGHRHHARGHGLPRRLLGSDGRDGGRDLHVALGRRRSVVVRLRREGPAGTWSAA